MNSAIITLSAILLTLTAIAVPADTDDCVCRAYGIVAVEGETVCLQTPQGPRAARCEKVLNNTSWTFLPGRCQNDMTDSPLSDRSGLITFTPKKTSTHGTPERL